MRNRWTLWLLFLFIVVVNGGQQKECSEYHGIALSKTAMCSLAAQKNFRNSFSSHLVTVNCSKCEIEYGKSPQAVQHEQSFSRRLFSEILSLIFPSGLRKKHGNISIRLPPNVNWYISIKNQVDGEEFGITVIMSPDPTCMAFIIIGTLLFFSAKRLSSSLKFYYTSGVGIGILASLLILVFILSRFVPKKPAAYTILIGGWSLGAWLMRYMWNNMHKVLTEYYMYFFAYLLVSGFLSFALCYWRGPITNTKTQHIIQWSIQLSALTMLYLSSQFQPVSVGIVASVIIGNLLFFKQDSEVFSPIISFFQRHIWRSTPKPQKLLTEEEYRLQGERETRKALEELREFCNSPKCSPWKTLSRVKSPAKFVSFMDGGCHISDGEIASHEEEIPDSEDDDDFNLISEDDAETDDFHAHSGDNGTTRLKAFVKDPNISEDED